MFGSSPVPGLTPREVLRQLKDELKTKSKSELILIAIKLIFDNHNLTERYGLYDEDTKPEPPKVPKLKAVPLRKKTEFKNPIVQTPEPERVHDEDCD